jgi:hypothetical protein
MYNLFQHQELGQNLQEHNLFLYNFGVQVEAVAAVGMDVFSILMAQPAVEEVQELKLNFLQAI